MNFFEQELRKIVGPKYPDATFVGRACYVRLNDMNRAKICFTTCGTADKYEALQMTILNRNDGRIDALRLRLEDVLGKRKISNVSFPNGISPHIWTYNGKTEWYAYHPNNQDYQMLSDSVSEYLDVFMEQTQATDQSWSQTLR